jgi:deoxyribose-phosphate aldolase
MLRGHGRVPELPGFPAAPTISFGDVENHESSGACADDIENLVIRYAIARLQGRTCFGDGFYGWPATAGLGALWLIPAAAGWLARLRALSGNRREVHFEDFAAALGVLDRAATRLPAPGTWAEATGIQLDALCDQAVEHGFVAVCVNPIFVARAARRLEFTKGHRRPFVVSVAGFPLGANRPETKADEARRVLDDGAREIDMVVHIGSLLDGDRRTVRREIELLAHVVHGFGTDRVLKVILETAALSEEQTILGCRCAMEGEADFVKTSTGFHPAGGATEHHVRLLHRFGSPMKVKAAGGIRTAAQALGMIAAGADRIGTSSGTAILAEFADREPPDQ